MQSYRYGVLIMKYATDKFKTEMNETFRNKWLGRVVIGALNNDLQSYGNVSTEESLSPNSSSIQNILYNSEWTRPAMFERTSTNADGSSSFYDSNSYQGVMFSKDITSSTTIVLKYSINEEYTNRTIEKLVINFALNYPRHIKIDYVSKGVDYSITLSNNSFSFEMNDKLEDITEMTITLYDFVNDLHLMIGNMLFGDMLVYSNDDLSDGEAISYEEAMYFKSDELPHKNCTIVINNTNNRFDIEGLNSETRLLEKGQDVYIMFGYEYEDGNVEYIQGQKLLLSSWDLSETAMTITCVDQLNYFNDSINIDYMTTTGETYRNSINNSLSSGYEDVMHLSDMTTFVPQGMFGEHSGTRKESLLMCANAFREVISIDNNDEIHSTPNFFPILSLTPTENDTVTDSNNLFNNIDTDSSYFVEYATFEQDVARADGVKRFPRKNNTVDYCGYISHQTTDDNNNFSSPYPGVSIHFENYLPQYISVEFLEWHEPYVYSYSIYNQSNEEVYNSGDITNSENLSTIALSISDNINSSGFRYTVKLFIHSMKYAHRAITIKSVRMDKFSNYELDPNQYIDYYPTVTVESLIKNLTFNAKSYSPNDSRSEVYNKNVVFDDRETYIYLDSPLQWSDDSGRIGFNSEGNLSQENEGMYVYEIDGKARTFRLKLKDDIELGEYKVQLYGKASSSSDVTVEYNLEKTGDNIEISNNLILPKEDMYSAVKRWYEHEEKHSKVYTFNYLGDPILEVGDIIYITTKEGNKIPIRVETHQLKLSGGGLKGYIEGRRM